MRCLILCGVGFEWELVRNFSIITTTGTSKLMRSFASLSVGQIEQNGYYNLFSQIYTYESC